MMAHDTNKDWTNKDWTNKDRTNKDRRGCAGAAEVFSARQRLVLLILFLLLTMARLPLAWIHGRFLGEEGAIFFAYAWHRPAGLALWRSFAGYLNLGANGSTLLAVTLIRFGWLSLEAAPHLTMMIALLFQGVPAALILTGRAGWLANRHAVNACLFLIATVPMSEEVFANVLHIQFYLALASALILGFDTPVRWPTQLAYGLILFLAPLCGPGAIILLPLFMARSLVEWDFRRARQLLFLAGGAVLQMLLFYTHSPVRGASMGIAALANMMFLRLFALPFGSQPLAHLIGKGVYALWLMGGVGWWCFTALSLSWFVFLAVIVLRGVRQNMRDGTRDGAVWLIASSLLIGAVSYGAGMLMLNPSLWFDPGVAERYNFLPLALLGVGFVALVMGGDKGDGRRFRKLWLNLCVLQMLSGSVTFFFPLRALSHGPNWMIEVARWQKNHDYRLATWPDSWRMNLSNDGRRCSLPNLGLAIHDPSWCESTWLARVVSDSKRYSETPLK